MDKGVKYLLIVLGVTGLLILLTLLMIAPVQTYRLRSSLRDSTTLRIRTGGHCHRHPERERVLLETQQTSEIESLLKSIAFALTSPGTYCMCCGDLSFEFYQGDELVKSFSLHHDRRIRIQYSSYGDIELTWGSRRRLAKWLEDRQIDERLRQFNEDLIKQVPKEADQPDAEQISSESASRESSE